MSNTLKTLLISTLAYLITSSVILSSVHAKDLASQHSDKGKVPTSASKVSTDLSAKAISELHNHVDKTVFKAFAKSTSDQASLASGREQRMDRSRYQRTMGTRLMEASLIIRLVFARAFSF